MLSHCTVFALWKIMYAPQTEGYHYDDGNDFVTIFATTLACLSDQLGTNGTKHYSWLHGGNIHLGVPTVPINITCPECAVMLDQALEYRANISELAVNDETKVKLAIQSRLAKYMHERYTKDIEAAIQYDLKKMFGGNDPELEKDVNKLFKKFDYTVELGGGKPILIKMRHKLEIILK